MAGPARRTLVEQAPEVVPGLRLLPVVHGRVEMAALVRAVLDAVEPAAVAVELPTSFANAVGLAVARLPKVSLVLAEEPGEETVVWTVAPGDPFSEALRWAAERDRPGLLIDPDLPYPERHADAVPDPYALLEIGAASYLAPLVAAVAGGAGSEADRRREVGMAYHLRRALDALRGGAGGPGTAPGPGCLLALVGAAHARRLAIDLATPQAVPLARVRRTPPELRHLHPRSLTALLVDPPLAHAAWELLREGELPPEPELDEAAAEPLSLVRAGLTLVARQGEQDAAARRHRIAAFAAHRARRRLPGTGIDAPDRRALGRVVWDLAARSHARQTHEEVAPWQRRTFFDFAGRLARTEGQLATGLYGWVVAARGVGDDNLAWEAFEVARAYPWQEATAEVPTVEADGAELDLGTRRVRFRRRFFRVKRRPVAVPVRERATTDDPGEWLRGFDGGGLCSYPPEDLVVEGFGRFLRERAVGLLAAERERVEPFSSGILDGIDLRETLRHPDDPRVWVRERGRSPGKAGAVVVIFDRDPPPGGAPPRYPYRMTWLGERHDESDMAFYSTSPASQVVGPGILRATYGGFVMTLPPGRLFDVWRDPEYRHFDPTDTLLAAGIDYSEEPLVVHVAERPPSAVLRRYAVAQRKRIVHLPLGSLAPATLRKVRVLHILVGRDKREIARKYVW